MEMVTGIAIVSALVKLVIDRVRKQWPKLDGDLVVLFALGLGTAATFVPDVMTVEGAGWVERVSVGAMIAGVSSLFHDVASVDYGRQTEIGV